MKYKTKVEGPKVVPITSPEQAHAVIQQMVLKIGKTVDEILQTVPVNMHWLIYARAINSLFSRLYNPAIARCNESTVEIEKRILEMCPPKKSKYKTNRFNTVKRKKRA